MRALITRYPRKPQLPYHSQAPPVTALRPFHLRPTGDIRDYGDGALAPQDWLSRKGWQRQEPTPQLPEAEDGDIPEVGVDFLAAEESEVLYCQWITATGPMAHKKGLEECSKLGPIAEGEKAKLSCYKILTDLHLTFSGQKKPASGCLRHLLPSRYTNAMTLRGGLFDFCSCASTLSFHYLYSFAPPISRLYF